MDSLARNRWRAVEWFALFVCLPLGAAFAQWKADIGITVFLKAFIVIAVIILWRDKTFDRKDLFRLEAIKTGWRRIVYRFVVLAAILGLVFALLRPAPAFQFPRQHTIQWALFVLFFPIVPAYPEELIFRVFFLHRYRHLFSHRWLRITMSALGFSLGHLHLANGWALALSFCGGLLFADTFERTHSAALICLEHALWGGYIFTIGLGPFFVPGL